MVFATIMQKILYNIFLIYIILNINLLYHHMMMIFLCYLMV